MMNSEFLPYASFFFGLADLESLAIRMMLEDRPNQMADRLWAEDGDFEAPVRLLAPADFCGAAIDGTVDCPDAAERRLGDLCARVLFEGDEDSHALVVAKLAPGRSLRVTASVSRRSTAAR